MASFFFSLIHICIYIYIPEYNLLNLSNVTHIYVFGADDFVGDINWWIFPKEAHFFQSQHSLVTYGSLCSIEGFWCHWQNPCEDLMMSNTQDIVSRRVRKKYQRRQAKRWAKQRKGELVLPVFNSSQLNSYINSIHVSTNVSHLMKYKLFLKC